VIKRLALDSGDVIGVNLHLLACKPEFMRMAGSAVSILDDHELPSQVREFRTDSNHDVMMEDNKDDHKALEVGHGSYIEFYKNGELQEHSFVDIYEGTYHAAVSLYMHGRCRVNFGKSAFKFGPIASHSHRSGESHAV